MDLPANKTAVFAQTPKTANAVATGACTVNDSNPANTIQLCTIGAAGAILTSLSAMPRGTVTSCGLALFLSRDAGVTKFLIASAEMKPYTMAATTKTPRTMFEYSEAAPKRLAAGDRLYVGCQVALAGGIVFDAEYTEF